MFKIIYWTIILSFAVPKIVCSNTDEQDSSSDEPQDHNAEVPENPYQQMRPVVSSHNSYQSPTQEKQQQKRRKNSIKKSRNVKEDESSGSTTDELEKILGRNTVVSRQPIVFPHFLEHSNYVQEANNIHESQITIFWQILSRRFQYDQHLLLNLPKQCSNIDQLMVLLDSIFRRKTIINLLYQRFSKHISHQDLTKKKSMTQEQYIFIKQIGKNCIRSQRLFSEITVQTIQEQVDRQVVKYCQAKYLTVIDLVKHLLQEFKNEVDPRQCITFTSILHALKVLKKHWLSKQRMDQLKIGTQTQNNAINQFMFLIERKIRDIVKKLEDVILRNLKTRGKILSRGRRMLRQSFKYLAQNKPKITRQTQTGTHKKIQAKSVQSKTLEELKEQKKKSTQPRKPQPARVYSILTQTQKQQIQEWQELQGSFNLDCRDLQILLQQQADWTQIFQIFIQLLIYSNRLSEQISQNQFPVDYHPNDLIPEDKQYLHLAPNQPDADLIQILTDKVQNIKNLLKMSMPLYDGTIPRDRRYQIAKILVNLQAKYQMLVQCLVHISYHIIQTDDIIKLLKQWEQQIKHDYERIKQLKLKFVDNVYLTPIYVSQLVQRCQILMINLHLICYVISKEITELKEKFDMTEGAEASSGVILDTNIQIYPRIKGPAGSTILYKQGKSSTKNVMIKIIQEKDGDLWITTKFASNLKSSFLLKTGFWRKFDLSLKNKYEHKFPLQVKSSTKFDIKLKKPHSHIGQLQRHIISKFKSDHSQPPPPPSSPPRRLPPPPQQLPQLPRASTSQPSHRIGLTRLFNRQSVSQLLRDLQYENEDDQKFSDSLENEVFNLPGSGYSGSSQGQYENQFPRFPARTVQQFWSQGPNWETQNQITVRRRSEIAGPSIIFPAGMVLRRTGSSNTQTPQRPQLTHSQSVDSDSTSKPPQ